MALRALNSIGGFSVGDNPQQNIILANGDITSNNITANGNANINGNLTANFANFSGNLNISNANATWGVLTDNLYYSNGAPWDLSNPAGSNGYIQYNDNGSFGASANFQFTNSTSTLSVIGLANVTGNLNVTDYINGNIGNFSGNITALNANLGNLATANFVNVSSNLNVTNTANVGNLNVANFVTSNLIPNVSNTYTLGNATNMWKDLYLSGTTIYIGTQNISANTTTIAVSNDFSANNLGATNNVTAGANIYANSGYVYSNYANVTTDLYVGSNANVAGTLKTYQEQLTSLTSTQIVYGNGSSFLVGSANFVFSDITNTLSVDNANLIGTLNGNIANFSGNLTSLNANLGNLATANYVNVNTQLNGNAANFTGTVTAANFNANGSGNVSNANVVSANSFVTQGGTANLANSSQVNLGNVSNLRISGGTANYVLTAVDNLGNVAWTETASTNQIHNGNSNVAIQDPNGNVTITANAGTAYTWTFANTNGSFNAPGDGSFVGAVGANSITANTDITANANIYANSGYVYSNYANVATDLFVGANANIVDTLTANIANITTLNTANANISSNLTVNNLTVNLELAGNTANFSGNVIMSANANVTGNLGVGGNITTSGSGGNITMSGGNINGVNYVFANAANITNFLQGANANFTGNVDAVNFIGNLANGSSNVRIDNGGNITFSPGAGYGNAVTISTGGLETIGYITANGTITSNTGIISNTVTSFANTPLTLSAGAATGSANIDVTLVPTGNGTVNVSSARITNLGTPTLSTDAATKQYVDDVAQGLNVHQAAYAGTTTTLDVATGGTVSYTQPGGVGNGVGAYLSTTGTFHFIDGANVQTVGTRILVKNEANAVWNGVYTYANTTAVIRATDEDQGTDFDGGDFLFITAGDTLADTGWVQTTNNVTVGTSNIVFAQFSGAGSYTANTSAGLILNGTQFSAKVDGNANPTIGFDGSGNLYVPANAAFTTPNIGAATGTSIDLTGNVLAGNVNSNAKVTAANIEVTGNILTNNLTANVNITATGNLSGNNANITNLLEVGGNANITLTLNGNIANFSGNLTAANANLGNLATANYVNVATQINGNVANFSGNLTAANANLGNLATANYVNVANDLTVSGTANIANLSLTGNITGVNNISVTNNISANSANIGNTLIKWANTTTTSTSANQTIAYYTISSTDIVGIEFLVKSYDSTNPLDTKYSVATVQAVTNGTDADYTVFGTVRLGNTTGVLAVNMSIVGSTANINLQATPASSNTTVWTTQYRLI